MKFVFSNLQAVRKGIPSFPWMLFTNTICPVLREIMLGSRAGKHRTKTHGYKPEVESGSSRQTPSPGPSSHRLLCLPANWITVGHRWDGSQPPFIQCCLRVGWPRPVNCWVILFYYYFCVMQDLNSQAPCS